MISGEIKERLLKAKSRNEIRSIMLDLNLQSTDVDEDVLRHYYDVEKDLDFDYNCVSDPPEAFGRKDIIGINQTA